MSTLGEYITTTNRMNSALYFELLNDQTTIECYGHCNVLPNKLNEMMHKFPQLKIAESNELTKKPSPPPPPPQAPINNTSQKSYSQQSSRSSIELDINDLIGFCLSKSPQLINDFK